jgi:tryptophanyl-tRNA synthetase
MVRETVLTGIKPTGEPHLGNYIGMIRPSLAFGEEYERFYFIADYHALTVLRDPVEFRRLTYDVAASWLAMGLDPERVTFYRQSDLPEVFELTWLLACATPKGLLNRAHAYKAVVADAEARGVKDVDASVNIGLYSYPVLMAADILLFSTDLVPVGRDQAQHVEIARDIAERFNKVYGDVLHLPKLWIREQAASIPGLDGRKMSKSYGNTIPLFCSSEELYRLIRKFKTDSTSADEGKDTTSSGLFQIYREIAPPEDASKVAAMLASGELSWMEMKERLFETLDRFLAEPRARYQELIADTAVIDRILAEGAERARPRAVELMERVRRAIRH